MRDCTLDGPGKGAANRSYRAEPIEEATVKKKLSVMGLLAALAAAVMFWRRKGDDDEFLDEELE